MDYVNKIVDYVSELKDFYPAVVKNATKAPSISTPATASVNPFRFYESFGLTLESHIEYICCGLVILFLFVLMKYETYRFIRANNREVRVAVLKDMKKLLEEKFSEDFFEYVLKQYNCYNHQSTQVEISELETEISSVPEPPSAGSTPRMSPKTPRQSRIPIPQITPLRRSNSDGSPSKTRDRGDPGIALRGPTWERRNR